ncbi:hypothetical protein SUGI_0140870 [Cryptomeria japonica]|nr:hypothetical protein SUGI_0140870 [Cryptomeria japonica]
MVLQREDLLLYGGVAFFVALILYDVISALRRGAILWLPSNNLVIYGLILQLAAEAEVMNVSISSEHQLEQVEKLRVKQLSIDSARLTLCVFVGYLLPGMATTEYAGLWTTIAALLVSLITHIFIEFFIVVQSYVTGNVIKVGNNSWVWLIVSGVLLLLVLLPFFICMVIAISVGKYYRDNLSRRIAAILGNNDNSDGMEWENMREEMMKSWIVARVSQPEYMLTRSPFSAGVGVLVTICVAFFGAKVVWFRSVLNQRFGLFVVQYIFILVVWIVILYRWLRPLYYLVLFTKSLATLKLEVKAFWGIFKTPLTHVITSLFSIIGVDTMPKYILAVILSPLFIGIVIIKQEMHLIKHCWLLSVWVIDKSVIRKLSNVDTMLASLSSGDFCRYKEVLESLRMPGEDVASLWIANESCYKALKLCMETAYKEGRSCKELIEVIGSCVDLNNVGFFADQLVEPLPIVKKYFPGLVEPLWSLTAVCLLKVIIEVTPDIDHTAVDNAVKAYNQASRLMDLVGCPDNINITVDFFGAANLEGFLVSVASKNDIENVKKTYEKRKGKRRERGRADTALTLEAALCIIQEKLDKAEKYLQRKHMLEEVPSAFAQGTYWLTMAPSYANYKVCKLIMADSDSYSTVNELREKLLAFLKDVISSCVKQLPDLLLNRSRKWAEQFEEEKIYKAAAIVGKARGVIDAATNLRDGSP